MTFDIVKLNAEDNKLDIYTQPKYQINASVETWKYQMTVMRDKDNPCTGEKYD